MPPPGTMQLKNADYVVVAFGDSPTMATELAALVVGGRKRATCSLVRDYAGSPETLPRNMPQSALSCISMPPRLC